MSWTSENSLQHDTLNNVRGSMNCLVRVEGIIVSACAERLLSVLLLSRLCLASAH